MFGALADGTGRAILGRLVRGDSGPKRVSTGVSSCLKRHALAA